MLKAASKKRSNIDIQSIQRIARESRSETLARLQASAEGFRLIRLKKTVKNMVKTRLSLIPMLLNGVCFGNRLRHHLR